MAPRRRPRKVGLKRMDAAIDALQPLGFSKDLIRKTVKSLLKVYEGDSGWIFIEEASYKLVIETILEEQEKSLVVKDEPLEAGARVQYESSLAMNSIEVGTETQTTAQTETFLALPEGGTTSQEDLACGQKQNDMALTVGGIGLTHSPPAGDLPCRRRKPCYGWISSDDEEDNVILKTDDSLRLLVIGSVSGSLCRRKRKTRWDVMPEDL